MSDYSLTLAVEPTYEPIAISELKQFARIRDTADDGELHQLIIMAREAVEGFTNRKLITQSIDWRFRYFAPELRVPKPPLQSVTSITYIDPDGNSQVLSSAVYEVDQYQTPGRIVEAWGQTWPSTRDKINAITVRYVAGYGTPELVPRTLRQACLRIAAHNFDNREDILVGTSVVEVPISTQKMLYRYRVNL